MSCDTKEKDSYSSNFIKESVTRIDKIQKEVVSDSTGRCVACGASLFTSTNNTVPVRFFSCCGNPVTGFIGIEDTPTNFFRIESIRSNRFVTLRLLESTTVDTATTLVGTDYTMILDLDCVGTMQCFEPILVEVCGGTTPTTTE